DRPREGPVRQGGNPDSAVCIPVRRSHCPAGRVVRAERWQLRARRVRPADRRTGYRRATGVEDGGAGPAERGRRRGTGPHRRLRTCGATADPVRRLRHLWSDVVMDPRAGQPAQPQDLVDVDALLKAYYDITPDVNNPAQKVVFGTSGHRGSSLDGAFNEA